MLPLTDHTAAHQRRIADLLRQTEPCVTDVGLGDCSVEFITRVDAVPLILKYEWLGNVGKATTFVGLFSPHRKLYGVACFGFGPGGHIRNHIGSPALCLERGACVHFAPKNAASYLITRACRLVYRTTKVSTFFAYGDPSAGEYGGVYQAANWLYIGQGIHGKNDRSDRTYMLAPGMDPNIPSNWKTTRVLRQGKRHLSYAQAEALGWTRAERPGKHVYATDIGPKRRAWRKRVVGKPYPAPREGLKRRNLP